jgi:hypothetical protein
MQNLKFKFLAVAHYLAGTYNVVDCSSSSDFGKVVFKPTVSEIFKDLKVSFLIDRCEKLRDAAREQREYRANDHDVTQVITHHQSFTGVSRYPRR